MTFPDGLDDDDDQERDGYKDHVRRVSEWGRLSLIPSSGEERKREREREKI